jgi:hypothetical protein
VALDSLSPVRLFRRRDSAGGGGSALAEPPAQPFTGSDEDLYAEIARLTAGEREAPDLASERTLLRLRNEAGIRRVQATAGAVDFADSAGAALPAPTGVLPEFSPAELTPQLLRAAILRDGCALVRGLIARDQAAELTREIDHAYAERERYEAGQSHDPAWYDEFTPDPRVGERLVTRGWIKEGGGLLGVDSPAVNFHVMELFAGVGVPALVGGYLGEPPLISAQKTTLRRAEPSVPGGWHQDGRFMGPVRSLNLWLSLSRCGDVAPGLDIVPRRLDYLVTSQTDEAMLDYVVSQRMAEEAAGELAIVRPIFDPGDALFFDELFLHKTGSDPDMPNPRFAIENWFFGASGWPSDYAPLAV